jgi:O-antigen/teichoic acid export membrane protein
MKNVFAEKTKAGINLLTQDLSRVWRAGAVHISASQWLSRTILIVQQIVLARILGAANIGHIAVVRSSMALLNLPAGAGIITPTTKLTAEKSGDSEAQANVLATGFWFVLVTSSVVALITLITLKTTSVIADEIARDLLSVVVTFIPLIALSQIIVSFLAGQQKMRLIAKVGFFLPVAGFVSVVFLCYFWGLKGWLVNYVGLVILGFCIYRFFVGIKIPFGWNPRHLSRMVRIGLFAFLGQSVGAILLEFDTLCISGIMKDAEATGIYNTAAIASQQLLSVVGGILYTVFPYVAKNQHDLPKLRQSYKELSLKLFLLSCGAGLCAWFVSPWFFPLFGPKFVASIAPFRILVFGFLCRVQSVLANTYLAASGRTDIQFVAGILAAICNITLNILFIPKWGIMGAAWATVASLLLSMIMCAVALHYFIFYKEAVR